VKTYGDKALYEFTEKFDKIKISNIKVNKEEIEIQASKLDNKIKKSNRYYI